MVGTDSESESENLILPEMLADDISYFIFILEISIHLLMLDSN